MNLFSTHPAVGFIFIYLVLFSFFTTSLATVNGNKIVHPMKIKMAGGRGVYLFSILPAVSFFSFTYLFSFFTTLL